MNKIQYDLTAKWWGDDQTPAQLGGRFLETLDQLSRLSPVMGHWSVADCENEAMTPLNEVRARISDLISKNVLPDDDGEIDPRDGYWLLAEGGEVEDASGPRSVAINIRAGSQWRNRASIEPGGRGWPPDLKLVTYPFYLNMLKILATTWPCPWIESHAFAPNFPPLEPWDPKKPSPPDPPRETYYFPWLLYLSAPFVSGLNPPRDLNCESTPGEGMILSAVSERLDPTNPDHVRRSRLLGAIIAERLPKRPGQPMLVPPPRVGPY